MAEHLDPGPWRLEVFYEDDTSVDCAILGADERTIVEFTVASDDRLALAGVRLMAASREVVDLLDTAVQAHRKATAGVARTDEWLHRAAELVAKLKGPLP